MQSLLSPKFDSFRFQIPTSFFNKDLLEKYSLIYNDDKTILTDPIEFFNQTIVAIEFLGMGNGTNEQDQFTIGTSEIDDGTTNKFGQRSRIDMNKFPHAAAKYTYRTHQNVLTMIDKTFKVTFRHTLGFWNYFMIFEQFMYQTMRDTESDDETLTSRFNLEILDPRTGQMNSKVVFIDPLIDQMDSIAFSNQQVHPDAKEFTVTFKFNNIDYQFAPFFFQNQQQ